MNSTNAAMAMRSCIQKVATGPEYSKNLSFDEAHIAMKHILSQDADPVQTAVFFIALRMKREIDDENKGVLQAIIDESDIATANVSEVVDVADPYDGHSRGLPVCAFIPPVLSALGIPAVNHGLEVVGPKYGITTRKVLRAAGVNVDLSPAQAAAEIENPDKGWAYVDQKAFSQKLHDLISLRSRIIKRQVLTTVEVLVGPVRGKDKTHLLTGYVHKAYPPIYAELARFAGFDSAMIVRGVEGGVIPSLGQPALLWSYHDKGAESSTELDPTRIGITQKNRAVPLPKDLPAAKQAGDEIATEFDVDAAAAKTAELGMAALKGEKGLAYDSLVYSSAITLHHLGKTSSLADAADEVRKVLDTGAAYSRLGV